MHIFLEAPGKNSNPMIEVIDVTTIKHNAKIVTIP
jgi:cystathionine beta-lyase/cystathionine gamma-synthase